MKTINIISALSLIMLIRVPCMAGDAPGEYRTFPLWDCYQYTKIKVAGSESGLGMTPAGDGYFNNGIWYVGKDSAAMLSGPIIDGGIFTLPVTYGEFENGALISYQADLRMTIDGVDPHNDSTVALLKLVIPRQIGSADTLVIDSVRISDFGTRDNVPLTMTSVQFQLYGIFGRDHSRPLEGKRIPVLFLIEATGARRIGVDYLTVYDHVGKTLAECRAHLNRIFAGALWNYPISREGDLKRGFEFHPAPAKLGISPKLDYRR